MKLLLLASVLVGLLLSSCQTKPNTTAASVKDTTGAAYYIVPVGQLSTPIDPNCQMNLTESGVADTLRTADGKLVGFCSAHCKDEYQAAQLKAHR